MACKVARGPRSVLQPRPRPSWSSGLLGSASAANDSCPSVPIPAGPNHGAPRAIGRTHATGAPLDIVPQTAMAGIASVSSFRPCAALPRRERVGAPLRLPGRAPSPRSRLAPCWFGKGGSGDGSNSERTDPLSLDGLEGDVLRSRAELLASELTKVRQAMLSTEHQMRSWTEDLQTKLSSESTRANDLDKRLKEVLAERDNAVVDAATHLYPVLKKAVSEELDGEVERSLAELRQAQTALSELEVAGAEANLQSLRKGVQMVDEAARSVELEALASVTAARAAGTLADESATRAREDARQAVARHAEWMRKVETILDQAAKAERAALVNKAECYALGKEVEHLRKTLDDTCEALRQSKIREQEIESSASDRVKEANRRADDRIHAAEEAFKHLRRQMEDKVRGLEHELDQKRREGDRAKNELTELRTKLASAEQAVSQAVARADAASSSVEERLKELAEQFEQASSARAAAMEADFQRRTAEERELILAEARGVLSAVESALERASDARSAAQDEVGRRVSMVERDAQSWRSKFEEAKASLREMSQARDQPLRLKDFKDAASLKDMRYEDLIQGVMARAKSTDAGA